MSAVPRPDRDAVERFYLAMLPELIQFAQVRNRYLPPFEIEEVVAETLGWAWSWCLAAEAKGRLHHLNPRMISLYAKRLWRSGRRFAGSAVDDVLAIQSLGKGNVLSLDEPRDADGEGANLGQLLSHGRHVSPLERCRVNVDYGIAMAGPQLPRRAPECFRHLARDHGPGHVQRTARAMRISSPRVSQLKRSIAGALRQIDYGPSPRPAA